MNKLEQVQKAKKRMDELQSELDSIYDKIKEQIFGSSDDQLDESENYIESKFFDLMYNEPDEYEELINLLSEHDLLS
jgi:hypothetical protein